MKNRLAILFVCVVFAMSIVLLTGCHISLTVDTSGRYKGADLETVNNLTANKNLSLMEKGLFNIFESVHYETKTGKNQSEYKLELTALMNVLETKAVGNIVTVATTNGESAQEALDNIRTPFFMDGINIYLTLEGEKVYMPISSADAQDISAALEYIGKLLENIDNDTGSDVDPDIGNMKYFVYENGNVLKIKMKEESSITINDNSKCSKTEVYMVFEGDALSGLAMSMEMTSSSGDDYTKLNVEMQLGATDEQPIIPDLSDYKPY